MATQSQDQNWMSDWSAIGEQFWNAWQQGARQANVGTAGNPAMDQWQRLLDQASTTGGAPSELLERGMDGVRQYVDFMQNAARQLSGDAGGRFDPAGLMHGAFRAFDVRQNPLFTAFRGSVGQGVPGVEEMLRGVQGLADPMREQMTAGLRMPAFGQHREVVERQQQMAEAMLGLQEPVALYQAEIWKALKRGVEIFELKLAERSEPGREITSMRALYDLWIDAAEEGYAEIALSVGFRRAYGALANAQMRMRQLVQQSVERATAEVGMPGRTEMDSVLRQLHDLRRRLGDAEEALAAARAPAAEPARKPVAAKRKPATRAAASKPRKPGRKAARSARSDAAAKPAVKVEAAAKVAAKKSPPARKRKRAAKAAGGFDERLAATRKSSRKRK